MGFVSQRADSSNSWETGVVKRHGFSAEKPVRNVRKSVVRGKSFQFDWWGVYKEDKSDCQSEFLFLWPGRQRERDVIRMEMWPLYLWHGAADVYRTVWVAVDRSWLSHWLVHSEHSPSPSSSSFFPIIIDSFLHPRPSLMSSCRPGLAVTMGLAASAGSTFNVRPRLNTGHSLFQVIRLINKTSSVEKEVDWAAS